MFYTNAFTQLTNTGSYINIPAGIYINAQCDIVNNNVGINTGTIENDGTIITTGHLTNNGSFLSGNASNVRLEGDLQNLNGAQTYLFNNIIIDGTNNKNLNIDISIAGNLTFNAHKILLNNNNISLLNTSSIITPNNQKFVVTNGTGMLIKKALAQGTDFLFPVGDATNSYKPITINAQNNIDTFAVRVIDGVYPSDQTTVQKTYIIKESAPLGTTAHVSLGWNTSDEGTAFQAAQTLMWQNISGTWTSITTTPAGAVANTPETDWKYTANDVQFVSLLADSFILKSGTPPIINTQPQNQSVCEYATASFSVSATGMGTLTYQWQVNCSGTWSNISNGGTFPAYSGANDSILLISNVPFTHNGCLFRCVVSNIAGSTISNDATLLVYAAPYVSITGDTALCEGDTTILTAQTVGNSFLWSTSETTQSITVNPNINQTYSITVTDVNTCTASTSVIVQVTPTFNVNLTSNYPPNNEILAGQNITFTADPSNYDTYTFLVNSVSVQNSTSNIYSTSTLQNGNVVTVVAYVNDCAASDSLIVKVKPIANAFTPFDADSKNDVFAKGVDLVIFNRWGQVIYEGKDGWDGTYNGNQVSYGTYYYIMKMNEEQGTPQTLTGVVTVISKNN